MNIEEGFQIDTPYVFVPWAISQRELKKLLGRHGLRHIAMGYFTSSCVSLDGMNHELGFHFDPPTSNELSELEFFLKAYPNQKKSYETFQFHFEKEFGKPTEVHPGSEGFDTCIWRIGSIEIAHSIYDRFGPEEHMTIRRISEKGFSIMRAIHSILSYFANSRSICFTIFHAIGFFIVFLIVLPVLIIMGICVGAYGLFQFLLANSLRRFKGKMPKL